MRWIAHPSQAQMRDPIRAVFASSPVTALFPPVVGRSLGACSKADPYSLRDRSAHLRLRGLGDSTTRAVDIYIILVRSSDALVILPTDVPLTARAALNRSGQANRAEGTIRSRGSAGALLIPAWMVPEARRARGPPRSWRAAGPPLLAPPQGEERTSLPWEKKSIATDVYPNMAGNQSSQPPCRRSFTSFRRYA